MSAFDRWLTTQPGEMEPVEIEQPGMCLSDHNMFDPSAHCDRCDAWDEWPIDEVKCALCDTRIGSVTRIHPELDYEVGAWVTPWELPDGRMVCEDCAFPCEIEADNQPEQ